MTITESEILTALQAALSRPEGHEGMTAGEMAEASGVNVHRIHKALRKLLATGQAQCVKVTRTRIDGQQTLVPAYRRV